MSRVLVVAPSRHTRGGITAVVLAYESSAFWMRWGCWWLETHIDKGVLWKLWYFVKAMLQYLPRLPFCDLVHIHLSEPNGALRKALFALPAFCLRKPVVLHFHSFSPETTIDSRWKPLYRFLFRRACRVIVLSPFWERAVRSSLGDVKVQVIPNPCAAVAANLPERRISRPYILFAGTLNARKGYSELIRAFAKVAGDCPEWDLVLAGNGEMDAARQHTRELGVEARVRLPGWVVGTEKAMLFRDAGMFCLPSYAEGFPMAVLDAFSYGLPVVTTPVGGIPDILVDGVSAAIVPCGDVDALAAALKSLATSPSLRDSYSAGSLRLAKEVFSLESICSQLDALYSVSICLNKPSHTFGGDPWGHYRDSKS